MAENNYLNLNNHLFSLLEECESGDIFCQLCYRLLQKHVKVKNVRIAKYKKSENLLDSDLEYFYQSQKLDSKDDYLTNLTNLFTTQFYLLSKGIFISYNREDQYLDKKLKYYLNILEIDVIYIFPLIFKKELLGYLVMENADDIEKLTSDEFINICRLIAKYLAIFLYQDQLYYKNKELKQEEEKLLKNKEQESIYLSQMNHELRTPISAVIGFSKMLKQQLYGELNPKQIQYVEAIYDSGNYLLNLVTDLLDIAKIEAQKEELYLESTLIKELCESCLFLVKQKAKEQGLELNLFINSQINSCFLDAIKVKQILVNLLSNAVKFTEVGSVTLKVDDDGKYLRFSVIDTGIGISELSQKKLFKAFSQIKSHLQYKQKGTGLGLKISLELAKLHKGDITVTSMENKGSCFTLLLPIRQNSDLD